MLTTNRLSAQRKFYRLHCYNNFKDIFFELYAFIILTYTLDQGYIIYIFNSLYTTYYLPGSHQYIIILNLEQLYLH